MDRKKPSRVDIIIGAAVTVIGAVLVLLYLGLRQPGARVIVSADGKEVVSYDLSENVDVIVQEAVKGMKLSGRNRLIIRDGEAWIEEADCPDRLCVHQGKISHTNESIVCLPHRISVRIVGESDKEPDAIVK